MNLKLFSAIAAILLPFLAQGVPPGISAARADTQGLVRSADWSIARSDQDDARDAVRAGRILPLGQVLQSVRRAHSGQLLDADLLDRGGRPVYRIKLLSPEGNVTIIICDAKTGRILRAHQGGH